MNNPFQNRIFATAGTIKGFDFMVLRATIESHGGRLAYDSSKAHILIEGECPGHISPKIAEEHGLEIWPADKLYKELDGMK